MTDTNTKVRSLILTALMVVSVFGGSIAFAGSAAAANSVSFDVANSEAGATTTYTTSATAELSSQNGFQYLDVTLQDADLSSVTTSDVTISSPGTDGGSNTFTLTGSDIAVTDNGDTLDITIQNSVNVADGDIVNIEIANVGNPSEGATYDYSVDLQTTTEGDTFESWSGTFDISASTTAVSSADADTNFDSASIRWQGQTMFVKDTSSADQTLALRRVTGDTTTTLVREVTLDGNGEAIVDSSTLQQGTYVFSNPDGSDYLVFDSNGVQTGTNSDTGVAGVEIAEQDLTIDPSSDTVTSDGSSVDFDVDSNRGGSFDIVVSSDNYTDAELESVISDASDYESDEQSGVLVNSGQGETITATFASDAENGEFTLDFSVEDTTAADSATFTVSDPAEGQLSLEEGIVSEERGDVGQITVNFENTDEATIVLGSDEVNYAAELTLTDGANGDADGTVTVNVNTFLTTEGDGSAFSVEDTDDSVAVSTASDYTSDYETSGPLATADYDIVLQDSSGEDVGVGTFVVTERSTDSMQLWTAADLPTDADQEAVYDALEAGDITQDSTIAYQDEVVHQIGVSGVYGALVAEMEASDVDAEQALLNLVDATPDDDSNDGALTLSATQAGNFPNSEPLTVDFAQTNTDGGLNVVADSGNNTVFVALDTTNAAFERDGSDVTPSADSLYGQTFDVEFGVLAQSALVTGDEDETVSASFSVEERTAELNGGDDITVEAASGQEITGTTNVAPGTEINIRARASGNNPFLKTANGVTVGADGTFSGTFDFSDVASNTTFTVTASTSQSFAETVTIDGTVSNETDMETPTPTPEPATDTPTPEPATDTPTEGGATETETSGSQPGFGGAVAIVALAGAALIALRRNN